MGIKNFVKNTVKDNVNVKGWASWGAIKDNAKSIGTFMDAFKADNQATAATKETFDEAVKRYGLSEKDIAARMKSYFMVAVICAILGAAAFLWMFYLFFLEGMFLSGLVALALSVLMFSYAFREHFRYYQMKQRRLDCTFQEWLSHLLDQKRK